MHSSVSPPCGVLRHSVWWWQSAVARRCRQPGSRAPSRCQVLHYHLSVIVTRALFKLNWFILVGITFLLLIILMHKSNSRFSSKSKIYRVIGSWYRDIFLQLFQVCRKALSWICGFSLYAAATHYSYYLKETNQNHAAGFLCVSHKTVKLMEPLISVVGFTLENWWTIFF